MKKLGLILVLCAFGMQLSAQEFVDPKLLSDVSTAPKKLEKAPKKVFIRNFKVYYQLIAEAEKTNYGGRQLGGGTYKGDATARMCVAVEGLSTEGLQKLTNDLYQEYYTSLEEMGFEVYTAANIPPIEFYEGWEKIDGPHINEEQYKGYLMIAPANYSYMVKRVTNKGKEKDSFIDKAYKVSEELEDMIVADVEIKVPSIWLDASAKLGGAKVKGGPFLRLDAGSKVAFQSGRLNKLNAAPLTTSMTLLKKPAVINGVFKSEKFKTVAQKQSTNLSSIGYASFFTVQDVELSVTNTLECDEAVYVDKVGTAIREFIDLSKAKFAANVKGEKLKY